MRITYLTPTRIYSGGEKITLDIAIAMQKRGHHVVYMGLEGPIKETVTEAGVPFHTLPIFSPKEVRRALQKHNPDFVHCMDFRASTYASLFSWPVIAHLHNNPPWLSGFNTQSLAMAFFAQRAHKILTVSHSVWDEFTFKHWCKRARKNLIMLPNYIFPESILKKSLEPCPHIPHTGFDLAFMGRFVEQKQPLSFVDCVAKIRQKIPNIRAVMLGHGELYGKVEEKIRQHNLTENISLVGVQKNPFPWLAASKLLLMPSAWEGFGLAAVEALTLGKPVVARAVGGLKDIISPACGALCQNDLALADAAYQFLCQDEQYIKACAQAKIRAQEYAYFEKYMSTMENVYLI